MSPNAISSITISSPCQPVRHDPHRRVFIGPLPETIISQIEAQGKKKKGHFEDVRNAAGADDVSEIIKNNAFHFFIRRGGRAEHWGENEERGVREEMLRRWKDSEWAAVWSVRKQQVPSARGAAEASGAGRWVGGSFEVGQFLGANVLQGIDDDHVEATADCEDAGSSRSGYRRSVSGSHVTTEGPAPLGSASVTREDVNSLHPAASSSRLGPDNETSETSSIDWSSHTRYSGPVSSDTSLLRSTARPGHVPETRAQSEPATKMPLVPRTGGVIPVDRKGKGKLVHYTDPEPTGTSLSLLSVAPEERRRMREFSTGTASTIPESVSSSKSDGDLGDVTIKDRILVRSCYTKAHSIGSQFDEEINRTTQHLEDQVWAEYLVVWRNNRLELYKDHKFPFKELFVKQKDLAFVIPLKSPATRLSLYSFVDLTFCLTCPAIARRNGSKPHLFFFGEDDGTSIFIFKLKSRSRAYDWIWQLWRQLGGKLPSSIEVWNPQLDTKVKIDIPNTGNDEEIYKVFDRENAVALCMNTLRTVPNWNNLIEREIKEGKSLELAWRVVTHLDWIWLYGDVQGNPRQWGVLCGLALKQPSTPAPALLELRVAEHFPSYVRLKNGNRLHQPPAIEGFLERIKPSIQTKQAIYIATHDGNLFVLPIHKAYPPAPPGFAPNGDDLESYAKSLRKTEGERGMKQIMHATGVTDLRKILLIRRAIHPFYQPTHHEPRKNDNDIWFDIWSQSEARTPGDESDVGGEEGLKKCEDRPQLRMRRSFELLLTTGNVIRFEAYSCRVAIEWIERLRALVLYWKQRHRIDAKEEMDLAQAYRPRLTPPTRVIRDREYPPEAPPDASAPLPALGSLYNWCVLEGCKPIIKGGKIFMRKGLRGQYKLVQLFLIDGHLVRFRITPGSSLNPSMHKNTNLIDAYICSGYLAALALPEGQYVATVKPAPRRYQDGLEAYDREEDMLFLVWYRPQSSTQVVPGAALPVPALSAKRKILVFRTRSKLERDAWCWALNCELERLVRKQKEREERLRDI